MSIIKMINDVPQVIAHIINKPVSATAKINTKNKFQAGSFVFSSFGADKKNKQEEDEYFSHIHEQVYESIQEMLQFWKGEN